MGLRIWGNQHGHGVKMWGKHAKIVLDFAKRWNLSHQEAFNRIMREAIKRWKKGGRHAKM